jgi:translocation and assembly module TamA
LSPLNMIGPGQNTAIISDIADQDPEGPIPSPDIPDDFKQADADYRAAAASTGLAGQDATTAWRYKVEVTSPQAPELSDAFMQVSLLEQMRNTPPDTLTGLNQRIRQDLEESKAVLSAYGFYEGQAWSRIELQSEELLYEGRPIDKPGNIKSVGGHIDARRQAARYEEARQRRTLRRNVIVHIHFVPGQQYTLGRSSITAADPENGFAGQLHSRNSNREHGRDLDTLDDVNFPAGSPAVAEKVLRAVDLVRDALQNNGYPYAEIADTRYVVDYDTKTLEADIKVNTGPISYMGELKVEGDINVGPEYLDAVRNWRDGRLWNAAVLDNFSDALRQTGLFQTVNVKPADQVGEDGLRPIIAELSPALERTVTAALKYNTDFGMGLEASWTHRNLTGRGDRLSVEMPLWEDMQIVFAQYRLPFFMDPSQDFVAQAALRNEDIDAYDLSSLSTAVGLERRFNRFLSGSAKVSAEGGEMKTPDESRTEYIMFGLPLNLTYDRANSLLDATSGYRLTLQGSPYTGSYHQDFNVVRTRLDASAYLPLLGENKLVLALRGSVGSLLGSDSDNIPATIRYYSGGGGSVRGYSYQSLGPRNSDDDPLGGASLTEVSAEARYKPGENWGLAAFLDGGMVYSDPSPDFGEDLRWGAGLGFRYYTIIGPVRFDVATPLNGRDDDDSVQIYISIGQSF